MAGGGGGGPDNATAPENQAGENDENEGDTVNDDKDNVDGGPGGGGEKVSKKQSVNFGGFSTSLAVQRQSTTASGIVAS